MKEIYQNKKENLQNNKDGRNREMTFREQIRNLAGSQSYSRGLQIYNRGKVLRFHIEEAEDVHADENVIIEADVEGSRSTPYHVYLMWNTVWEDLVESECSCPAFWEYDGICKHCVAVLLRYYYETKNRTGQMNLMQIPGIQKGMARKTTGSIQQLLQKGALVKSLPMIQGDICGKVRLEPHMVVENTGITVSFKLGINRMYVLKDVFGFARAIENHEKVFYGKNLQFIHAVESFVPQSRPLVSFLVQWAEKNEYRYGGYHSYYSVYGNAREKQIDLSANDMETFLELMKGQEILASVFYMDEKPWKIVEQIPERTLKILGKTDGIEVSINRLSGIRGNRYNIFFSGNQIMMEPMKRMEPVKEFLECMAEIPERKIFVEKTDVPLFCMELLPALEQCFECTKENFDEQQYGVAIPEFSIYLDAPQTDMITCRPQVQYDKKVYSLYETRDVALRDLGKEAAVREVIQRYGEAYDERQKAMVITDEDKIYDLLTEGIPVFQQLGEVYISDTLKGMQVHPSPKVAVGVSIESGLMQLKMTAGEMSKEELIDILSRYNKRKKYYRLKDGSFVQKEDSGLDILADLKETLQLTDQQLMQESVPVDTYRALYIDQQLRDNPVISSVRDKNFRSLIRNMKTVEDNDFEIPAELEPILRGYQKTGFLWLKTLSANGFGGILADDMGLGKTLQVIAVLLAAKLEGKTGTSLVVAPAALVFNWGEELARFAPQLKVSLIAGSQSERQAKLQTYSDFDVLVTSYDLLKRDIDQYEEKEFLYQIIDEAQYIKNHTTAAAKSVKVIHSQTRYALTGTPIENRLSELWSIFDYLMPGFLYGYDSFKKEFETPIVKNDDESAMTRLQKMVSPFILRRLKEDVLKDLPEKLEEVRYVKFEDAQQKLYDAQVVHMKEKIAQQDEGEFNKSKLWILAELTKLRQICCSPSLCFENYRGESAKAESCMQLIQSAIDGGHRMLLFSQFTSMLALLQAALEKEGIPYYIITGETSKQKRQELVKQFNSDTTPVFLISLKAGGVGLNLTGADVVIHYDPWWNQAVQNQATDRAHRIGQTKKVTVYKLIARNTIEEKIQKLQEAKQDLAEQIISGDMGQLSGMSREDILELL